MLSNVKQVLLVMAHAADETYVAGGLLAALDKSVKVTLYIACYNDTHDIEALPKALRVLHPHVEVLVGRHNTHCLHEVPVHELSTKIAAHIDYVKPDLLITHCTGDTDPDHCAMNDAVITACRIDRVNAHHPQLILGGEGPSSKSTTEGPNCLNCFMPLADIQKKLRALSFYNTPPSPLIGSIANVDLTSRVRGGQCQSKYGEAYTLIRMSL